MPSFARAGRMSALLPGSKSRRRITPAALAVTAGGLAVALGGALATVHSTRDAPRGNLRPPADSTFTLFETGQVRPLALSPGGPWIFALNTPANRLEVFAVAQPAAAIPGALTWVRSVPVGLEPVAVAARSETEVWVVNHLSDSVSIVDVGDAPAVRVV